MKLSTALLLVGGMLIVSILPAQRIIFNGQDEGPQTLMGNNTSFGGFVSLSGKASSFNQQDALLLGGEAAFTINRRLNIGVAGYGVVNLVNSNTLTEEGYPLYHEMGDGGLLIEPILMGNSALHITFPVVLGAGGVTETAKPYTDPLNWTEEGWDYLEANRYGTADYFFIAEPGVSAELTVARWLRLVGGVSHRFTTPTRYNFANTSDLNGWSSHVTLRLGWY